MIITDIKQQAKNKRRYSVFIDGKFDFGLTDVDILFYGLKIGDEISPERREHIFNEAVYTKAKEKAVSLICYRERSKREITERLSRDYSSDIVEKVLEFLEKYGYINDAAFAEAYAKDSLKNKKWGRRKIEFELKMKGVNADTIQSALDNVLDKSEVNQSEVAAKLLERRLKGQTELTYKERAKHTAYLAGRGFSFDDISEAFSSLNIEITKDYY
jgi:regulatory protein